MALTTIDLDDNLKMMFDSTKHLHNCTLKELLHEAIRSVVQECNPVQYLENEMAELEIRISKTRLELAKARVAQKYLEIDKEVSNEVDEYLEQMRNEKYRQYEKSLIVQWNKNNINWQRFVDAYQFNNKKEAREWLQRKLMDAGAI